jgi:hypothetical protein
VDLKVVLDALLELHELHELHERAVLAALAAEVRPPPLPRRRPALRDD